MNKRRTKMKPDVNNTRNSSGFFTLGLDNEEYILTKEVVADNTEEKILRMRHRYPPKLKFVSYTNGKLELDCTQQESSRKLTILIERDKLQISCSCNTAVKMLCLHAYEALNSLIASGETGYFRQFRPNGLFEIARSNKKLFEIRSGNKGLSITPRPGLGIIYSLENDLRVKQLAGALGMPVNKEVKPVPLPNDTTLAYIIVQSWKNRLLPFPVPCTGQLNKKRDFVMRPGGFIRRTQKKYDKWLDKDQRVLNQLCHNIWQIVKGLAGNIMGEENDPEEIQNIQKIYDLWRSALPLLQLQPFLYLYFLYWKKELKKRPDKNRVQPIKTGIAEPELRFRLINKGNFYQFDLRVFIKNREIKAYIASPAFFIRDYDGNTLFLLASLRDAAIVEWMKGLKNKITIFKEHYKEFVNTIIRQLRQYYTIEMTGFKRKKFKSNPGV